MSAPAFRAFTAGEVSPSLYARTDLAAYARGLRTLRNALVMKTGGAQSRPGTVYKGGIKGNTWARLIPCVFDDDQNYLLEFGNGSVRFWKNGTQITGTVTGAWADATAYAAGLVVSYSGTNYVCLVAHTSVLATNRPSTGASWQTYWYALSGTIYELPTPWTTQTIVRQLQTQVEAADGTGVMRIAHNSALRRKLTRVADAQWYFTTLSSSVTLDAPANLTTDAPTPGDVAAWCVTAYDSVNQVESLASSPVSSNTAPASPGSVFTEDWDAVTGATSYRVYRSDNLSVFGFLYETTSTSYIDTGARSPNLAINPPEEVGSLSSSGYYPGVIGAYQQRVLVAGSTNEPSTVRASRVGAGDDFTVSSPLQDADAVTWTMVGERVVRPRHFLEVAQRLVQFSNIDEKVIEGDDTGIIVPGGVNPRRISANGAAVYPGPLPVNDTALYVQARGGVIRDLLADAAGSDLTVSAAHLIAGYTIPEWCYQQTPHSVVWAVRSDGVLLSLTYQRESGVLAWAHHDTDGTVESVACVPESGEDAVYCIVTRSVNSATVRYLERLADRQAAVASLVCMDAAASYSGVAITSMTGLSHLEGKAVAIIADSQVRASPYNSAYTTRTVSGGAVTLGGSYTTVHVGLPFVVDVGTLDLDRVSSSGKDAGINVTRLGLWLEASRPPFCAATFPSSSTSVSGMQQMPATDADGNTTTALLTDYREVGLDGAWGTTGRIAIRHVDPSPLTVLAIVPQGAFGRS